MKSTSNLRSLNWFRVNGAGNTFFVAESTEAFIKKAISQTEVTRDFVKEVCNGFTNFSTDGVILLNRKSNRRIDWAFYNSDGSTAEMCGNAARCVGLFTFENVKIKERDFNLFTTAGPVRVFNKNRHGEYSAQLTPVKILSKKLSIKAGKKRLTGLYINTGVPHFVIFHKRNRSLAKELRWDSKNFGISGTNVTFLERTERNSVEAITFERGVEDFTASCGTGAAAAATAIRLTENHDENVKVIMPGGELTLSGPPQGLVLSGPTKLEFEIRFFK